MTPNASSNASGNVFLYILIAVILFGALSFTISKSSDSNPQRELSDASAKTAVTGILAYEAQAKMAISQMVQNGAKISSIDFTMPSNSSFNTAPTLNKIFHPDGGGLQYKFLPQSVTITPALSPPSAYLISSVGNIQWTPTTQSDIVFVAYGITQSTCEILNAKITGSSVVPVWNVGSSALANTIINTGTLAMSLGTSACTSCDGKAALCVKDASNVYLYYSILNGR